MRTQLVRLAALFGFLTAAALGMAAGPVDLIVLPLSPNLFSTHACPLKIGLSNSGDEAIGTLVLKGPEFYYSHPFRLAAKQKLQMIVYADLYDKNNRNSVQVGGAKDVKEDWCVDVSLNAKSKSGSTEISQIVPLQLGIAKTLIISDDRHAVQQLAEDAKSEAPSRPESGKGASAPVRNIYEMEFCEVPPSMAPDREPAYSNLNQVILGSGTESLSEKQMDAIIRFAMLGGELIFSKGPNSAFYKTNWSSIRPHPYEKIEFGLGTVYNLNLDLESKVGSNPLQRHYFLIEPSRSDDLRASWLRSGVYIQSRGDWANGRDPFAAAMPSFSVIAFALAAYFLAVVPLNVFILRKLQKTDLMWITAPACAVLFAGLIFRSTSGLEKASGSVNVVGSLVSIPEHDESVFTGTFSVFSPRATTLDFGLKNVEDIKSQDPVSVQHSYRTSASPILVQDTGSLNISDFRTRSLQFKSFFISQVIPTKPMVKFEVGKPTDGIYPIVVTNVGNKMITDIALFAGEYSSKKRNLAPGEKMTLMVDKVRPVKPDYLTQPDSSRNWEPGQELLRLTNQIQAEGRVALFGIVDGLSLGPNMPKEFQYHSQVQLAAYAPVRLGLP